MYMYSFKNVSVLKYIAFVKGNFEHKLIFWHSVHLF